MTTNQRQRYCDMSLYDVMYQKKEPVALTHTVHNKLRYNSTTKKFVVLEMNVNYNIVLVIQDYHSNIRLHWSNC